LQKLNNRPELLPKMTILAGVCGGRKEKKVKIYDIIIPEQIIDIITGKYENHKFIPYGYHETINEDLIKHLKKIVQKPNFIKKEMNDLIPNTEKYKRENEIIQNLKIHFDTLACGSFVLKTKDFLETKAKEISDKIVGFEMESYGVARALYLSKSNKYGLVVKSVMDYTDDKKNDILEGENVKQMAAYMSYICIRALLPHLEKYIKENISEKLHEE
jgi:nucleoside phosphorylase